MITGELKNKIDSLWDIFAAGGLVNPLDVIEQITYLMFIHDLDDTDNLRAKEAAMLGLPYQSIFADEVQVGDRTIDGQQLKWSVFHDFPAGKMYSVMQEWVFPFIKNLHGDKNSAYSKYMDDAIFKLPTPLLLSKVVDALDEIYRLMNESQAVDVLGFGSPMGRVIAMLACAAGGMMVFHGNDDFFWVTATTSDMDTSIAYKTIPIISVLQSMTALVTVFLLSMVLL